MFPRVFDDPAEYANDPLTYPGFNLNWFEKYFMDETVIISRP